MRNSVVRVQRSITELMIRYSKFRPIIEKNKPQYKNFHDEDLAYEWYDVSENERQEIIAIRAKTRKLSRIIKSY